MVDFIPGFPNAAPNNWRPTSDATSEYNCLSWSVHRTDVYIWPDSGQQFAWPVGMARGDTLDVLINFYKSLGFEECSFAEPEKGFEKIAIYVDADGPAHIARQLESGFWASKMGEAFDIEHSNPNVLEGGNYGSVRVVMRRRWNGPPTIPHLEPRPPRLITVGGMPLVR